MQTGVCANCLYSSNIEKRKIRAIFKVAQLYYWLFNKIQYLMFIFFFSNDNIDLLFIYVRGKGSTTVPAVLLELLISYHIPFGAFRRGPRRYSHLRIIK